MIVDNDDNHADEQSGTRTSRRQRLVASFATSASIYPASPRPLIMFKGMIKLPTDNPLHNDAYNNNNSQRSTKPQMFFHSGVVWIARSKESQCYRNNWRENI